MVDLLKAVISTISIVLGFTPSQRGGLTSSQREQQNVNNKEEIWLMPFPFWSGDIELLVTTHVPTVNIEVPIRTPLN